MGACCADEERMDAPQPIPELLKDLPEPSTFGLDTISAFEATLPFKRIEIHVMMKKIEEAETAAGGGEAQGFVTLQSLRKELPTPAWKCLTESDSALSKMLLSDIFKNPTKG